MDSELIYTKTAFGEEAMHQRTRVMQRNVRMVLILVDGQSTVADLCLKTGNLELTETALKELEKGGFVEPLVEQDSLWAESKRVAQEIRSAAIDKALQFVPSRPKEPSLLSEPSVDALAKSGNKAPGISHSLEPHVSQFSTGRFQEGDLPGMKPIRANSSDRQEPRRKKRESETDRAKSSLVGRLTGWIRKQGADEAKRVAIKPIRRGARKPPLGWPLRILLTIAFLSVLGYLTVLFFPYQYYLPELQAALSNICARPVTVREMRVDVYPKPGLFLTDVTIGKGQDELRIAQVHVQPDVATVLEPKKGVREVLLSGVVLTADSLTGLHQIVASVARPESTVTVKRIRFENAGASFGSLGFRQLDGEAMLSDAGLFRSFQLRSADRGLTVGAVLQDGGVDFSLEGFGWSAAQGSSWRLDSMTLKGRIKNSALTIGNLDIRLFDGLIKGALVLREDGKPSLAGDLTFERIDSAKLGGALGIGQQLTGDLAGSLKFSTTADTWPEIFSAVNAEGQFVIQRGRIQGVDLTEAVRRVSANSVQGGSTEFEQLSGQLKLSPTTFRFSGLNLVSGLMQSSGAVRIGKDLSIDGEMVLRMRGSVNQTRVPVAISGTLKSPELKAGPSE